MEQTTKHFGLLFFAAALITLLLLAGSLSSLQLADGTPLRVGNDASDSSLADEVVLLVETHPRPLLQGIMALGFVGLLVYLGFRVFRFINVRTIIWTVIALTAVLAVILLLPDLDLGDSATPSGAASTLELPVPELVPPAALDPPPPIFVRVVILVVIAGITWLAIRILLQQRTNAEIDHPVLDPAQQAVAALYAGLDLRDVVLRCYMQMAQSLQEKHDIQREETMTVREFESWLAYEGFPAEPVHQLTSLFEKIRYSRQMTGTEEDEAKAIQSLNAIIQAGRKLGAHRNE